MAKGDLKCLDETGELWLLRPGDLAYAIVAALPRELRTGLQLAVLPATVLKGQHVTRIEGLKLIEKAERLSRYADEPDIQPVLLRLMHLTRCLRALEHNAKVIVP